MGRVLSWGIKSTTERFHWQGLVLGAPYPWTKIVRTTPCTWVVGRSMKSQLLHLLLQMQTPTALRAVLMTAGYGTLKLGEVSLDTIHSY